MNFRIFFSLFIYFFTTLCALGIERGLYFKLGYPYLKAKYNDQKTFEDYLNIHLGVDYIFYSTDSQFLSVLSEFSYSPSRDDLELQLEQGYTKGNGSFRTNYFGLNYSRKIYDAGQGQDYKVYIGLAPIIAQSTIKFNHLKRNDSGIKTKNKITLREYGIKLSVLLSKYEDCFWEFSYFALRSTGFSIVEDSSLDTSVMKTEDKFSSKTNQSFILSYNFNIF
jgi:hypothetical protein